MINFWGLSFAGPKEENQRTSAFVQEWQHLWEHIRFMEIHYISSEESIRKYFEQRTVHLPFFEI